MYADIDSLADWLHDRLNRGQFDGDILTEHPDLTYEEAYQVQFALMDRLTAKDDRIVGYKAAYTSLAMQEKFGIDGPVVGTLRASALRQADETFGLRPQDKNLAEPELAFVLGRDIEQPVATAREMLLATAGIFPAIEIGVVPDEAASRSRQMGIAAHKVTGCFIVGQAMALSHELDLRLEAALVTVNGKGAAAGTGHAVMNNPATAAMAIVNLVVGQGRPVKAGSLLLTGSLTAGVPIAQGDDVLVEFTHLGRVGARL